MRQLANQARQLANDAQDVRRQLQQSGIAPKELTPVDDVVKALRELGNEKNLQNPQGLQDLYATAVQKFKALEFEIRKRVDTGNEQLYLSGSEDVPASFKSLIEGTTGRSPRRAGASRLAGSGFRVHGEGALVWFRFSELRAT